MADSASSMGDFVERYGSNIVGLQSSNIKACSAPKRAGLGDEMVPFPDSSESNAHSGCERIQHVSVIERNDVRGNQ